MITIKNGVSSSPKAQAERLGGEVLSGELPTCLLHSEPFLPAQALLTPRDPYLVLKNNTKASMNKLLFLSFFNIYNKLFKLFHSKGEG